MQGLVTVLNFIKNNFWAKTSGIILLTTISYGLLLNNINLWSDEIYSVLMAKDSFSDMWILLSTEDSKPPLYYFYLKGIIALFPKNYEIFGAHFASYIILIFAQIFSATAIRKDYGDKVSIWMTAILMLNPISLWLAFEVRTYILSNFLLLVAVIYGLRLTLNPKNIDFVKFGIVSVLGLYSHYYVAIFLMFFYMYLLGFYYRDKNLSKFLLKFILTTGVVALFFIPWLLIPLKTASYISKYWYVNIDFVRLSINYFINPLHPEIFQSIFYMATTVSSVVFNFVVLLGLFNSSLLSQKLKRAFWVSVVCFLSSYLLLYILSYIVRPMVSARYLKTFSFILYFAGAIFITRVNYLKKAFSVILVIGFLFTFVDMRAVFFDKGNEKLIEDINKFVPKYQTIITLDNANLFCEYYLKNHNCILAMQKDGEILRTQTIKKKYRPLS